MASGDSAAKKAAAAAANAAQHRRRADRSERTASNWARGARGEASLASVTAPLAADGYHALSDRRVVGSHANIDLLLVGPAGVIVIDAKSWSGELAVEGKSLWQNGRRRDKDVERLRERAIDVSTALEAMGDRRPPVWPVICFVDCEGLSSPATIERVRLVNSSDLVECVRSLRGRTHGPCADEAMELLTEVFPSYESPPPEANDEVVVPDEPVIFLHPWKGGSLRRLYVKADDFTELGYLDLETGQVDATSDEAKPLLAQLLPHYVGSAPGSQTQALSSEAGGMLRRFLAAVRGRNGRPAVPPLLAAYRWRNYGKDRLYVHRIVGSEPRQELGWYDLKMGDVVGTSADTTAIVRYCGERHRSLAANRSAADEASPK